MKKNFYRLLSIVLLIVFTSTACGRTVTLKRDNNPNSDNIEATTEDDSDSSLEDSTDEDAELTRKAFSELTDRIFYEALEESVMTVHSILDYPEKMGITEYEYTLGDFSEESNEEYIKQLENYI